MKKYKYVSIIVLILILIFTTGCGDDEENKKARDEAVSATMLQGNPSGVWYMLSSGMAESLSRSYPGSVLHVTPGSPAPNALRIADNQVNFALTHTNIVNELITGQELDNDQKQSIRGVAVLYPSAVQFVLREKIGVKTLEEIITNKISINISIGSIGGSTNQTFRRLVEYYGTTVEKMREWGCRIFELGMTDSGELFSEKNTDGFIFIGSIPMPQIVQACVNEDITLIEYGHDALMYMCEKYGFDIISIDKNTYDFMEKEYETIKSSTMLVASAKTSEDDVYKTLKSIDENSAYIQTLHSSLKYIKADNMLEDMKIPLHSGAEKYYKEIGMIE